MNKVKITAILPCYNVEKYIRRGLDSVLAQTLTEWEAILVDDGATDSTGSICDEYARLDGRFRVVHTQNQGTSCARNTGMEAAKGELLYFMDPDDWVEPDCFSVCYEAYRQNECDMIQFDKFWVHNGDKTPDDTGDKGVWSHDEIVNKYTCKMIGLGQDALDHFYKGGNAWDKKKSLGVWSFMFNHSFINDHGLRFKPGMRLGQDILFAIECTICARKLVSIPEIFYNYDVRTNGTVVSRTDDKEKIFNDKCNWLRERARLRRQVQDVDLHDHYLGSQVLSALELCVKFSGEWQRRHQVSLYVRSPYVRESLEKVSLKGAPLKFRLPVLLLRWHCHGLLFAIVFVLRKLGILKSFV